MVDRKYHRERRQARRKKFIELLGGKCKNCGSKKNLHFDHRDPSKKEFHIARNINKSDENLLNEVKKCQLLCLNCHQDKTRKNWDFGSPESQHGTLWRYKKYKCRCSLCRKVMSDYYHNKLSYMIDEFIKQANQHN